MINRYPAPCRYCGGTVQSESGTVEMVGKLWRAAHVKCAATKGSGGPLAAPEFRTVAPAFRLAYP